MKNWIMLFKAVGGTLRRLPWLVWILLGPPWAFLMLLCYWYFLDTQPPLIINYSHGHFTSEPASSRSDAAAKELHEVLGGTTVWTYRELCVLRNIPGTLRARWDAASFSWTVPDIDFIPSPVGCRAVAYAVEVPTSNPTRNVAYNSVREYHVNPIKVIEVPAPPIPITILANR
jgi:hypothetical protein